MRPAGPMRPVRPARLGALTASVALLFGTLVARPIAAAVQEAEPRPSLEERVDTVFADYDNTRSPGCSLGVVDDGELVVARGYGMANLEHGVPLTAHSIFRIGSTSKQFTAASIVLLAQEGELRLDDDIRHHLPEMPRFDPPVTLRQLLHHTSGYRDYLTLMSIAGRRDDDYYTDADVLRMLSRQQELNFPPGTEYLYSNSGYWLLSRVVLRASGHSLREYAEARIFSPLAMHDTHFHDDHTEIVSNRASGYRPTDGGGFEISMTTLPMIGDGGVFTSVEDLTRWDWNFYEPVVGGSSFVEQMLERGVLTDGTVLDYAFGLGHGTHRGLSTVSHGGAFVGFRAQMLRFPDQLTTIICLCNRADANPSRRALEVADIVLEDRLGPPKEAPGSDAERPDEPAVELAADLRAEIAGAYSSEELGVEYHLVLASDGLRLAIGDSSESLPLDALMGDRLRTRRRTLRLQRDPSGKITGFLLDAGRVKNLRFLRLEP